MNLNYQFGKEKVSRRTIFQFKKCDNEITNWRCFERDNEELSELTQLKLMELTQSETEMELSGSVLSESMEGESHAHSSPEL